MTLIVLAGGRSVRFSQSAKCSLNKLSLPLSGKNKGDFVSVLGRALSAFDQFSFKKIVLVANEAALPLDVVAKVKENKALIALAQPGSTRTQSVYNALKTIESLGGDDFVLIHDGARPLVKKALIKRVTEATKAFGAATPAIKVTDTIKALEPFSKQGADFAEGFGEGVAVIKTHLKRDALVAVQTPQGFDYNLLLTAHKMAREGSSDGSSDRTIDFTDDTELFEHFTQKKVHTVEGDEQNIKITKALDYAICKALLSEDRDKQDAFLSCAQGLEQKAQKAVHRVVGLGYDSHLLAAGRNLVIGGVKVECALGEVGHSDGDALCHAVIDALLSPTLHSDVGELFPPTDEKWRDFNSIAMVEKVAKLLWTARWRVLSLDAVVRTDAVKLLSHKTKIRESLAKALAIEAQCVGVKAKTWEGFSDAKNIIDAQVVAQLEKIEE